MISMVAASTRAAWDRAGVRTARGARVRDADDVADRVALAVGAHRPLGLRLSASARL